VEFALVMPLLFMILFGIIQYGYGLFQLQALSSTINDTSRLVANGLSSCTTLNDDAKAAASGNGLDPANLGNVQVTWLNADGTPSSTGLAARLGMARVEASYQAFDIGMPLVPFPDSLTRATQVTVQDIGQPDLTGCT
jgi:Flp pilus assembly protein TadG